MTGFETVPDQLWQFGLIFMRVGGAAGFLPGFSERFLPVRIRLAIAFSISLLVQVLGFAPVSFGVGHLTISVLIGEITVGVILGLVLRVFLIAIQIAGSIAAQSTSLAQIYGGQSAEPLPAIGHLLMLGALALIMMSGYPVLLIKYLGQFYTLVPIGQLFPAETMLTWGISLAATVFQLGFTLAAPFIIASVIYNLTIGLINKAMPQMMVAFVGAPFITFLSLVLLVLTVPVILAVWRSRFFDFMLAPGGVAG